MINPLRIIANSVYGKFGSEPDSLAQIQVTINSQVSIKALIEKFKANDIHSISINTDGIAIRVPHDKPNVCKNIIDHWNSINKTNIDCDECKINDKSR